MSKTVDNIALICENISKDLVLEFDKDQAMILNNLFEYVTPKKARISFESNISESRDFQIVDYARNKTD